MSKLCPTSVNTLRIVTVHKNGKTTVMLRAIRIGNGINPVDNFHQGGMYSLFDDKGTSLLITNSEKSMSSNYIKYFCCKELLSLR